MKQLFEANFANSSDTSIKIVDKNGNSVEVLNSFNRIYDKIIEVTVKSKTSDKKILAWFNSNFKNWMKNMSVGYDDFGKFLTEKRFYNLFYPDIDEVIKIIQEYHGSLSHDEIMDMLPDYIKNAKDPVNVFSGGKLYRFKNVKFINMMGELVDYLKSVVDNQTERNYMLLPDKYFINDLSKLTPVIALKNTVEYHEYFERMQSKLSNEQTKQQYKLLTNGVDYEILKKYPSGNSIIHGLTSKYTNVEGCAMGHCVATYGKDVDEKKIIILSLQNKEGMPEATIELSNDWKLIKQLKGKKNGPVKKEYHEDLIDFIKDKKLKFTNSGYGSSDYKNIGLSSSNLNKETKESLHDEIINQLLIEAKQYKIKTATKTATKFTNFHYDDHTQVGKHNNAEVASKKNELTPELKTASAEKTKTALSNVKLDKTSLLHFLSINLDAPDEVDNKDIVGIDLAEPKSTMLPVVISTALSVLGQHEPTFHQVKNLPGYLSSGIRAIGRKVFEPFTATKLENIQVIANLNGSGPNHEVELSTVVKFLHDHGTRNPKYEIEFTDKIPGYKAEAKLYTFANFTFLAVRDQAGHYIYAWPSTDNKKKLEDASMKRLLK